MGEIESFGAAIVSKVGPMAAADLLALTDGKLVSGRGYEVATRWLPDLSPDIVSTLIAAYDKAAAYARLAAWNCGIFHTATGPEPPGGVDPDELLKYATTELGWVVAARE